MHSQTLPDTMLLDSVSEHTQKVINNDTKPKNLVGFLAGGSGGSGLSDPVCLHCNTELQLGDSKCEKCGLLNHVNTASNEGATDTCNATRLTPRPHQPGDECAASRAVLPATTVRLVATLWPQHWRWRRVRCAGSSRLSLTTLAALADSNSPPHLPHRMGRAVPRTMRNRTRSHAVGMRGTTSTAARF